MDTTHLHFAHGDPVWFAAWQPGSKGAVAGACIGLVLLAIFERLVSCMRGVLEAEWKRRSMKLETERLGSGGTLPGSEKDSSTRRVTSRSTQSPLRMHSANFILSHDLGRGAMHLTEATLSYLLLLTVWTRNAWYIISVITGLGVGQTLFGRFASPASLSQ